MGRIGIGWQLAKRSWSVLASDRSLMWFPVLSAIFAILATGILVGLGTMLDWTALSDTTSTTTVVGDASATTQAEPFPIIFTIFAILAGYVSATIAIFFNVALVSCVTRSIDGEDTTVGEGVAAARERLGVIIKWGIFSYTVGLVLRAIEERVPLGGRIAVWIAGAAWAMATLLVIPVLAFEGLGPIDALKRSAGLFKDRFGEAIIGRGAIAMSVFLVAMVPAIVLIVLAVLVASTSVVLAGLLGGAAVVVIVAAMIVGSTLTQVFNTALYRFAVDGTAGLGFDERDFAGLIRTR